MARAVLLACLPWLAALVVSLGFLYAIVRINRARFDLRRLRRLHGDEVGGVQSLSFVLTLPFFVMILLFIVQVSQLMIGTIVVHYAAFATARAATVWIPAYVSAEESENAISFYSIDPDAPQDVPVIDPDSPGYGPSQGGMTFIVEPGSVKYDKIRSAAVMACMPISPSRDLGLSPPVSAVAMGDSLKAAYQTLAPSSTTNPQTLVRIDNKLAYSAENTEIELRFYHKNAEPPLLTYFIPPDMYEFRYNELGWQDQISVKVKHRLALLPGPGRLLARFVPGASGEDKVSQAVGHNGSVYVYPLSATCVIGNEGEKSVVPYVHNP